MSIPRLRSWSHPVIPSPHQPPSTPRLPLEERVKEGIAKKEISAPFMKGQK